MSVQLDILGAIRARPLTIMQMVAVTHLPEHTVRSVLDRCVSNGSVVVTVEKHAATPPHYRLAPQIHELTGPRPFDGRRRRAQVVGG